MNKEKIKDAKKWLQERLSYIAENCDLNIADNKRAYNSLKASIECIEKVEIYKEELK